MTDGAPDGVIQRLVFGSSMIIMCIIGCTPSKPNELDKLGTVDMTIKGQVFKLWVADESEEQAKGLMFVTTDQMKPLSGNVERGMLFSFGRDQTNSFWMKNTIIPLDIAYVASDGRVVKTYTMAPLDDRYNAYPPGGPYRFAIEVNGNRFVELGVAGGDLLEIPDLSLKKTP